MPTSWAFAAEKALKSRHFLDSVCHRKLGIPIKRQFLGIRMMQMRNSGCHDYHMLREHECINPGQPRADERYKQAMTTCAALIVAAGRGARFGATLPKQYATLTGSPVLRHALRALNTHPRITQIQPVIHPDDHILFAEAAQDIPIAQPCSGGPTRQDSVRLGLEALAGSAPDFVLIHDGARPLIGTGVLDRVIEALENGALGAIPTLPVPDTLKRVGDGAQIIETVPRTNIVRAQTPQGFHFQTLLQAHQTCAGLNLTDDAAVMEHAGFSVISVPGDEDNIKITEAGDIDRVSEKLLETRVGMGFDVHRFGPGNGLTLGGVFIPMDKTLLGHSDADVVLHAATDAILGALGDGDIGVHFPPSDESFKGAASNLFFEFALNRLHACMGSLIHIDLTVICERPKLSPFREDIRRSIAAMAGVSPARISIKATTTEGLGFTGRGEGIACQAVATVKAAPITT